MSTCQTAGRAMLVSSSARPPEENVAVVGSSFRALRASTQVADSCPIASHWMESFSRQNWPSIDSKPWPGILAPETRDVPNQERVQPSDSAGCPCNYEDLNLLLAYDAWPSQIL